MDEEDKKVPTGRVEAPLSESIFKEDDEWLELNRSDWERSVRKGKNTLLVIGIVIFVSELFSIMRTEDAAGIYVWAYLVIVPGVFIALGILANRSKPYTALLWGLIAFIGYLVGLVILHTLAFGMEGIYKSLFSGILFKAIAIVMLVRSLSGARQLQDYYEKNLTY